MGLTGLLMGTAFFAVAWAIREYEAAQAVMLFLIWFEIVKRDIK